MGERSVASEMRIEDGEERQRQRSLFGASDNVIGMMMRSDLLDFLFP